MTVQENPRNPAFLLASLAQIFQRRTSPSVFSTPVHVLIMEFPGRWDVFPMEEYPTAIARCPGKASIEVMAQARANGRLIDHFKVTINGSEVLNVNFPLSAVFSVADMPDWRIQWDIWPRDIPIRRNMSSSNWADLYSGILSNEIFVFDDKGPVPKDKIEGFFQQGKGKLTLHAAFRWAVGISDDLRMMVGLYALPHLSPPWRATLSSKGELKTTFNLSFPVTHFFYVNVRI